MPPALHTEICDLLGIRYPIIQTGMGWVAKPELVAAVSNAGAIGFLAAATIPPRIAVATRVVIPKHAASPLAAVGAPNTPAPTRPCPT